MRVLAAMSGGVDSAVAAARAVGGRARRGRGAPGALRRPRPRCAADPAAAAPGRTPRTPGGPPTCWTSRSTSGTSPPGSAPTWSTTSWPPTPPGRPPTRACGATRRSSSRRCWTGRSGWASTRCAPGTTPGWPGRRRAPSCAGPSTRTRTSPTCWPCSRRRSWRTPCSRSATPASRTCGPRPPRAGCGWPTSRTATTSASSRPATPGRSWPTGSGSGRAPVVDADQRARAGPARRRARVHRRPAQGPRGGRTRRRRSAALRARDRAGQRHGAGRPGRRAGRRARSTADRPVWSAGRPPAPRFRCVAQVRAHGGLAAAEVGTGPDRLTVRLDEPLRGVAPGQTVALYRPDPGDGDLVLGSATITATVWPRRLRDSRTRRRKGTSSPPTGRNRR